MDADKRLMPLDIAAVGYKFSDGRYAVLNQMPHLVDQYYARRGHFSTIYADQTFEVAEDRQQMRDVLTKRPAIAGPITVNTVDWLTCNSMQRVLVQAASDQIVQSLLIEYRPLEAQSFVIVTSVTKYLTDTIVAGRVPTEKTADRPRTTTCTRPHPPCPTPAITTERRVRHADKTVEGRPSISTTAGSSHLDTAKDPVVTKSAMVQSPGIIAKDRRVLRCTKKIDTGRPPLETVVVSSYLETVKYPAVRKWTMVRFPEEIADERCVRFTDEIVTVRSRSIETATDPSSLESAVDPSLRNSAVSQFQERIAIERVRPADHFTTDIGQRIAFFTWLGMRSDNAKIKN